MIAIEVVARTAEARQRIDNGLQGTVSPLIDDLQLFSGSLTF